MRFNTVNFSLVTPESGRVKFIKELLVLGDMGTTHRASWCGWRANALPYTAPVIVSHNSSEAVFNFYYVLSCLPPPQAFCCQDYTSYYAIKSY